MPNETAATPPSAPDILVRVMPEVSPSSGRSSREPAVAGQPSATAKPAPSLPTPTHVKRRRLILWGGLGLFGLVVLGGAAALWFLRPGSGELPGATPTSTSSAATSTAQVEPEVGSGPVTAAGRDEVRLQHLVKLHTSLEQYRQANGQYPEAFAQLSVYLPELPIDPSGAAYPYVAPAGGASYQIQFTLETGGTYDGLRLIPGSYTLTPQGVQVQAAQGSPTSTSPVVPEPGDTPPQATADTDGDGLTDVEEAQYATDVNVGDTDGDGYVDGVEVRGGFNPLVRTAQTMFEAGLAQAYQNITQGYSVQYPTGWVTRALDAPSATQVTFSAPNGEFFEVLAEPNSDHLSAADWYRQQHPAADPASLVAVSYGGMAGVVAPDGLTVYLTNGSTMYVLVYSLGGASQASYATTFLRFQSSFQPVGN